MSEHNEQVNKVLAKMEEQGITPDKYDDILKAMAEQGITPENYEETTDGLGDKISSVLSTLGIGEDTVQQWLGMKEVCGCDKRKAFLNKILPFRKKQEWSIGSKKT